MNASFRSLVCAAALTGAAALSVSAEIDIDRLCPPRPETAAKFRAGAYPPAARPYREAALRVYGYMTGLPAMRELVEKGTLDRHYQHNAYVAKTHAAHIGAMLNWARVEPAHKAEAMALAKASADYLLSQLEPADAVLAGWPPTYLRTPLPFDPKTDGDYHKPCMVGNEPEGAVKYRGEVMLLYPADVGTAFLRYFRATGEKRFLDAARRIGKTYLKTRRADGSWPLKMKLATGETVGRNTLVPTRPLAFFETLHAVTHDPTWRKAADETFAWIERHPLTDWNWDGQFEDINPLPPYQNPTKHNAVDVMLYILERFPGDAARLATCRKILEFCEKRFVVWEAPKSHPKWPAPSVLEQYSCFTPIDASAAKMIRAYVAMYRAEGRAEDLAKAKALADTMTRVQQANGRIPTFWEGVYTGQGLTHVRYDWLNCMGASAQALLLVAEAEEAYGTEFACGAWKVQFAAAGSRLVLTHGKSGAKIEGVLTFTGPEQVTGAGTAANPEKTAKWKVVDARDGAKNRLALADPKERVHGYITFQDGGDRLSLLVYHRTAFAYGGELAFDGQVQYRPDAFACRVTPKRGDRVLSIRSGRASAAGDDALFSAAADEALVFTCGGGGGFIETALPGGAGGGGTPPLPGEAGGGGTPPLPSWRIALRLTIDDPAEAACAFEIKKDYYKSRWVPYYRPLDRNRAPHAPTGWLSWNTYFDQAGSKENLDEARFAAKWFKPFGMEIWNIESWQDNSDHLPVSKFYNMNLEHYAVQFPEGMKWLADEIRKLGFKPGLWMAPYGTGSEKFYNAHRDWFLHDANGKPLTSWNGRYTLDPTAPGALEHLTKIFDRASHEWGYEFFKIDGMSGRGPGYCAHMYEMPAVRARFHDPTCPNPFERTVAAFRKGIGEDRLFLACQGHFTGAEAAYADSSRTGADIVHPNQPVKWANILLQARCTVNQFFAHSIVFWSDPDCMLVSQGALEREQAQVEATVVSLPGQQTFAGDMLAKLAPDRVALIQKALPVCDTHPGNLYPMFGHLPVWDLKIARPFGTWHVVALFNWSDQAAPVGVDWKELGEETEKTYLGWEYWTGTYLGDLQSRLELTVPARSVRLVALQPALGRPQFLSSERHITQGGVELKDLAWDGKDLTAKVTVIGGFPTTVRFALPEGCAVANCSAEGAKCATKLESKGRVLAVRLWADRTVDAEVRVSTDFGRLLHTDSDAKAVEALRAQTDRRIAEIRATPNPSVPQGAPCRYLSEKTGSDEADGLTPATAWKTTARLNRERLTPGSFVLFARGGTYRNGFVAAEGVTYSAYGTGPKPRILASPENGANPDKWVRTDAENVWAYQLDGRDVGTVVFDEGAAHAIKILPVYRKDGKYTQQYGGASFNRGYHDLKGDLHFWHDYSASTDFKPFAKGTGKIYLYSKENPGKRFKSIEFNVKQHGVTVGGRNNVHIDNLCIQYVGAHGVGAGTCTGLTVSNCEFAWIGGSVQAERIFGRPCATRYGNAVEIYGGCADYTVTNCYIRQVYDAGLTHQVNWAFGKRTMMMSRIRYVNNVIEKCNYSIEYFFSRIPDGNPSGMDGFLIAGNLMWDAGTGFCEQRPDRTQGAHVKSWRNNCNPARNYLIRDNLFARSKEMLLEISSGRNNADGMGSMPILEGNTFIGNRGQRFGVLNMGTPVEFKYK